MQARYCYTILLSIFVAAGCHSDTGSKKNKPKRIFWSADKKLSWDDFEAPAPPNGKYDATTACNVNFSDHMEDSTLVIEGSCYFMIDSSWVVKMRNTRYLLNHEQRHFDLYEVIVRQFRKYLSTWRGKGVKEFERFRNNGADSILYPRLQELYDSDTRHGLNIYQQNIWNKQIDSLLEAYKDYADTIVKVPWIGTYNSLDSILKGNAQK